MQDTYIQDDSIITVHTPEIEEPKVNFLQKPYWALSFKKQKTKYGAISHLDIDVFALIWGFTVHNQAFFATNAYIAKTLYEDIGTVRKSFKRLEEIGLIYRYGEREKRQIRAVIHNPKAMVEIDQGYGKNLPEGMVNSYQGYGKNLPPYKQVNKQSYKQVDIYEEKQKKEVAEKFKKPMIEEVQTYCKERRNYVDADKFYNYYEANGWKVGKNSMKDWRAAVRTWESNSLSNTGQKFKAVTTHDYSNDPDVLRIQKENEAERARELGQFVI